jgi:hypothetical protein
MNVSVDNKYIVKAGYPTRVEYIHLSPASRRRRRKRNLVPGGIIGNPVPGGYEYGDLAFHVEEVSNLRQ